MIEDYVSYETAVLLKEKGYTKESNARYASGTVTESWYDGYLERVVSINKEEGTLIDSSPHNIYGETIPAPSVYDVISWLIDVHNICISISPYVNEEGISFCGEIKILEGMDKIFGGKITTKHKKAAFDTYDDCIRYCIDYSLKNLI